MADSMPKPASVADILARAARRLSKELAALRFGPPITHVYDPLTYAEKPHREYLSRFGNGPKRVVFLGMNPGPYGMAQTGVPFGEVSLVRGWLGVEAPVGRPEPEHPKRPITGFSCTRSEVSGARLWGALRDHFGRPEAFFAEHFVANYCPLVFMEETGRNRTPDKLPEAERVPLYTACDAHLVRLVETMQPEWVVGIGKFAEGRARAALSGMDVRIGTVLHPSPASPIANRGWAPQALRQLSELGIGFGAPRG